MMKCGHAFFKFQLERMKHALSVELIESGAGSGQSLPGFVHK